jgi:hypothetical protein
MHRGLMITFAASVNNARERITGSEIVSKADGDFSPLRSDICAELCTNASTVAQVSKVKKPTIRMMYWSLYNGILLNENFSYNVRL